MNYETEQDNAIAVVGMSIRFPGAGTIEEFWNNLRSGVESVTFLQKRSWRRMEFLLRSISSTIMFPPSRY